MHGLWSFLPRVRNGFQVAFGCFRRLSVILLVGTIIAGVLPAQEAAQKTSRPRHDNSTPWQTNPDKYAIDRIGERGIGAELNFYSMEQERAVGRALSQQFESTHVIIADWKVNDYLGRVANVVVRHSDAKVSLTVKVVDDRQVNAYDIPGGFIYVNSGLILAADDEASLACMLAHEIAHVAARHGVKYLIQSSRLDTPKSWREFYRDMEREADLLAIEYVYAAGYDPTAFVRFFEKVRLHKLVSVTPDHPPLQERIKRAQVAMASILPPRGAYLVTTKEFDEIRTRLRRLGSQYDGNATSVSQRPRSKNDRHP